MVSDALPRRAAGGALKKWLVIGPLLALAAFCAVPIPIGPTAEKQLDAFKAVGPLKAGAARVRIELPGAHPVLAGYAGHREAREAAAPVYARAIVLEVGGRRAVIASIDTLLIPPGFRPQFGCTLLAATHTHTGPGGLWDSFIAGWLGSGAPDGAQRLTVQKALSEAIAQAEAGLGPAALQAGREEWTAGPARARSGGPIDPALNALRLRRPTGEIVATLVVYAMHPTSAPRDVLSADWPGELEQGAPVLVLQGAVGNTTWPRGQPLGPPVAGEVEKLLHDAPSSSELPLECDVREPSVPRAQASRSVPWLLRTAAGNVLALAYDRSVTQTRLRIGAVSLLGVPGEPAGELGKSVRPVVLISLAGGYLGYVETPGRWEAAEGESSKTYFGPGLAHALGLWPR